METTIIEAVETPEREHCFAIRIEVFCGEQKVSRDLEFDGLDEECRHYLAILDQTPVGTARVRPIGNDTVKFERIAVLAAYRGRNIGKALMLRAIEDAAAGGAGTGVLNAQTYAAEFYEKLGFARRGPLFMEAGIEHVHMVREL
jgi:predicted GNAT family N-acyltransferase